MSNPAKTKRAMRAEWIKSHATEIIAAKVPESGSPTNARNRTGMSGGGWGYWAQAFRVAGVDCSARKYWSGSLPTPSTSINKGIADFVMSHAPEHLR